MEDFGPPSAFKGRSHTVQNCRPEHGHVAAGREACSGVLPLHDITMHGKSHLHVYHVCMTTLVQDWYDVAIMHEQAVDGEWDIPRLTKDAYDLKGKTVGTVAAGRIGCHVIKRLKVGSNDNQEGNS